LRGLNFHTNRKSNMNKLKNQKFGKSHQHWLDWVTKNSIRKNTMRKPPFDATKDVTEKDLVRARYIRMVEANIYMEQNRINRLERKMRNDRTLGAIVMVIGGVMWLAGLI